MSVPKYPKSYAGAIRKPKKVSWKKLISAKRSTSRTRKPR